LYSIKVRWLTQAGEEQALHSVRKYKVENGVLVLAVDYDHDIVIPLYQVAAVDIQRHK